MADIFVSYARQDKARLGLVDHRRASGKWGDFARSLGDDDFEFIK